MCFLWYYLLKIILLGIFMSKIKNTVQNFFVNSIRVILKGFINVCYRVRKENLDVPKTGRLLLVGNHVSYLDAVLLSLKIKRPIRFIVYYKIYNNFLLNRFFKAIKAIPIAGYKEDKQVFSNAFDLIAEALENEEAVFIFPEGMMTYNGEMNEFKSGIEHILKRTPAPVYPIAIKGLWGSYFSRKKNKPLFGKLFSKITLKGGKVIPADKADRKSLFNAVFQLAKN